jgi:NAD+ synthetase
MDKLNITIVQCNMHVGDIKRNKAIIINAAQQASALGADLIIFPECILSGYPPEDLLLYNDFLEALETARKELCEQSKNLSCAILYGTPTTAKNPTTAKAKNSAILLYQGQEIWQRDKTILPNYGVFDEKRVFIAGENEQDCFTLKNQKIAVPICEELWQQEFHHQISAQNPDLIISINASPFYQYKHQERLNHAAALAKRANASVIYCNALGGQDELVFDGHSFIIDKNGKLEAELPCAENSIFHYSAQTAAANICATISAEAELYKILTLGLRDFVEKNNFPAVLLGLSGGIDSALTAAIAVDALGSKRVSAFMLPSPYTSQESLDDATECANLLGIKLDNIEISALFFAAQNELKKHIDINSGTTSENLQARLRGLLLMAASNASGNLLLTTGNKSEMAVGYATLYGDMCGGFNPIKDLYKTKVYALANWRNEQNIAIPKRIITKAPSAELRPNQTDQDSLPEYEILDRILEKLLEKNLSPQKIIAQGEDEKTVRKIVTLLHNSDFKRRQSAPGITVTKCAFGRDWRMPITKLNYRKIEI